MRYSLSLLLALSVFSLPLAALAQDDKTAGETRSAGSMPGEKPKDDSYSETYKQLNLFGDVFERARSQYVEPVEDKVLMENAINGMLSNLDPHSSYLNEEAFTDMQVSTKGEFGGLGIEVTLENGFVKVVSPIDDTPAFRAGILAGDYIVEIGGEPVMGMALSDAVDKMRGKVGTPIKLVVRREGEAEPLDFELVRDIIKIQSVRHRVEGNVGYIRITTFNQNTQPGLEKAITEIKKELGSKLVGYVLDLRNNPGGLLDQAISVSDTFLDRGEIVSTRGRHESDTKRDNATPGDLGDGLPIVVLINGGSASASEIVSGALQDHKRAILLGTKSFGKGSVQTVIPLPGHGAMRLTTARYYTPSGRSIQAKGIEPDILVEPAKIESLKVGGLSEADLPGALKNTDKKEEPKESEKKEDAAKDKSDPSATDKDKDKKSEDEKPQDYQLMRAVDLINGLSLYKNGQEQSGIVKQVEDDPAKPDAEPKK